MGWYLWEPRSKDYEYEDEPGENPGLSRSDLLLIPVALVGLFWISLTPFIALFLYYLSDVYQTTKETMQTGEMAYPFLANLGIPVIFWIFQADSELIPARLITSVFVFNHTFLPYAAVCIYRLRSFFGAHVAG